MMDSKNAEMLEQCPLDYGYNVTVDGVVETKDTCKSFDCGYAVM